MRNKLWVVVINMNALFCFIILFCLSIGIFMLRESAIWINLSSSALISGKKIVIDPGHGGGDPGAKSPVGLLEKNINLDVALRLKKHLSRVGVYCIMIRETDRDFFDAPYESQLKKRRDLIHRTQMANQSGADLFLSIHANSFPQIIYRGAQTFFNPKNQSSRRLAQAVQHYLVKKLGPNNRRPKPGDFRVLNDIKMPGITIEIGFLSNPEEARLLSESQYRERIAEAIYHGIIAYLSNRVPENH